MGIRDPETSSGRQVVRLAKPGDPCTIQDLYVQECLLGVKLAEKLSSVDDLRLRLSEELPQNSPETRRLYAQRICTWLFPNRTLDSAPLLAWRAYHDEQILLDHFRVRYLEAIPLLGRFVTGPLASIGIGDVLSTDAVTTFVSRECGSAIPRTIERIPRNLLKLGFLSKNGGDYVRTVPSYDPTSVILEAHRLFGQTPSTTPFSEIVAHPFWRYAGVPDPATLEQILYWGVTQGLLAKFVKSDELNQITTGQSYRDLLTTGPRATTLARRG